MSLEEELRRLRAGGGTGPGSALRPPAGVYEMRGRGRERLSLLATTQPWGPRVPVTVRHLPDGCWRLRIAYNSNHWQAWDHCVRRVGLIERAGRTFQSFDFVAARVSDLTEFRCVPPVVTIRLEADPGSAWPARCAGRSPTRGSRTVSAGTNTYVGPARVRVGEVSVLALRYRQVRTISGDQSGRERTDLWWSARDARLLRLERRLQISSPSPLGDVVYREDGVLTLSRLEPRR